MIRPTAAPDTAMPYQLTIQQEPQFLHAIVTGANDADTVARYLDELRRACIARQCYRVLIEERLAGPRLLPGLQGGIGSQ